MRGNEPGIDPFVEAAHDEEFPIPMRGNELSMPAIISPIVWDRDRFPIPMRGNECYEVSAAASDPGVSDPHEG